MDTSLKPKSGLSFSEKFRTLFLLYNKVKPYFLLAEEVSGKFVIAPVNELRAVLDHVFKSYYFEDKDDENNNLEVEIDKAVRHLKRAGYDALEVIAISKLPEIKKILCNFDVDTIQIAYPDYYSVDKPKLMEIEKYLAERRDGIDTNDFFDEYEKLIAQLLEIDEKISKLVPVLSDVKKRQKHTSLKKNLQNIFIGIIIGVLVAVLVWFFGL